MFSVKRGKYEITRGEHRVRGGFQSLFYRLERPEEPECYWKGPSRKDEVEDRCKWGPKQKKTCLRGWGWGDWL